MPPLETLGSRRALVAQPRRPGRRSGLSRARRARVPAVRRRDARPVPARLPQTDGRLGRAGGDDRLPPLAVREHRPVRPPAGRVRPRSDGAVRHVVRAAGRRASVFSSRATTAARSRSRAIPRILRASARPIPCAQATRLAAVRSRPEHATSSSARSGARRRRARQGRVRRMGRAALRGAQGVGRSGARACSPSRARRPRSTT